jgi:hypothetical protein
MMIPTTVLLLLALAGGHAAGAFALHAATAFMHPDNNSILELALNEIGAAGSASSALPTS